jgi:hypothetical protein
MYNAIWWDDIGKITRNKERKITVFLKIIFVLLNISLRAILYDRLHLPKAIKTL